MTTRHTCGGQHARGTSDYTGLFEVVRGVGENPVSSPDLKQRVTGLEREPSPVPSLSPSVLSLGATSSAVPPVSDSIIIEGPGVTVPLDYVPTGIYQGLRVWSVPVPEDDP